MLSRFRRYSWSVGVLAGAFALGMSSLPEMAGAQGLELEVELFVSGLDRPLAIVDPGDGSGRLFLVEQTGKILIHDGAGVLPTPFLDLSAEVSNEGGEKGLLGLAFHPSYESNGLFFVAYTEADANSAGQNDLIVARYQVSADPNVADAASELRLMQIFQPYGNHNGGHLAFGPDGYLYIGVGDGGSGGDPGNRAQNLDTLLGKLLRIDVDSTDGGRSYAIPPSNPFVGGTENPGCSESCPGEPCGSTCDEIWAYGLRNPWRFSFDRETGDLFIGDVGQNAWEEVDSQPAESTGGENYGWRVMEGSHCYPPDPADACTPPAGHVPPILEYPQDPPGCYSVTGGFVYRGAAHPRLDEVYLYADYCSGVIWGTVPSCGGAPESRELLDTPFFLSSFGEDASGELYVADLADVTGEVYRLVLAPSSGGPDLVVAPAPIDFGSAPGGSLEVSLTNANLGPEALLIRDLALAVGTDFGLNLNGGSNPCLSASKCLPPGASCTVELTFSGAGTAWFLDSLSISSNSDVRAAPVGACTASANVVLSSADVVTGQTTFDACETITAGGGFEVMSIGDATLRAGDRVIFDSGVSIAGRLEVWAGLP